MDQNKKGFSLKGIFLLIIVTAILTSLTTGIIMYNNNKTEIGDVNVNKDEALKEFLRVYSSLDEGYYEDINKTEMIDSAISGMLEYLGEDYSTYMDKDETDDLADFLSGKYFGIGISIIDKNKVYKVYSGTPASEAGIKENDLILKINGEDTDSLDQSQIASKIKQDAENTILLQRGEEQIEVKVKPKEINSPLTREVKEANGKKVGYIYIESFNNTVAEEFRKALEELENAGIESLIIDMRENTGGLLLGATDIASMFLEKGKIIYSLEGKDSVEAYKDNTKEKRDYKIAILINGSTASASEILTTALQESYGAITVGSPSYGKGKVQQTKTLEDGSMVKYTTARWLTPSGECIDGMGIFPDYSTSTNEETTPVDEEGNPIDRDVEKALEILTKE